MSRNKAPVKTPRYRRGPLSEKQPTIFSSTIYNTERASPSRCLSLARGPQIVYPFERCHARTHGAFSQHLQLEVPTSIQVPCIHRSTRQTRSFILINVKVDPGQEGDSSKQKPHVRDTLVYKMTDLASPTPTMGGLISSNSSWATLREMADSQHHPDGTSDEKEQVGAMPSRPPQTKLRADSATAGLPTNPSSRLAASPAYLSDSPQGQPKCAGTDEDEESVGAATATHVVDFEKPFDPADPMQWAPRKKIAIVLNIALLSATGQMASSMIAPSAGAILAEFHVDARGNLVLAVLVVTVFLLGMAVGLLLTSGFSEVYGRVAVIHVTNVLFVGFAAAAAAAGSLAQLIGFRFLQGLAAAAPPAVGGGVIGDMFAPKDRGRATSIYGLGMLMGPMVGPIAGGYITESVGWRWNCWVIAIVVS